MKRIFSFAIINAAIYIYIFIFKSNCFIIYGHINVHALLYLHKVFHNKNCQLLIFKIKIKVTILTRILIRLHHVKKNNMIFLIQFIMIISVLNFP
jgi:hypothetical protein